MNIIQKPAPENKFTKGRLAFDYIIMHWGVTYRLDQIDSEIFNPNRAMTYHYALDGNEIHQYVSEEDTAWHCTNWNGNQRSIGICINAKDDNPYNDADYEQAAQLISDIFRRHGKMEIKGHRDFAATQCPGPLDFGRLNARVEEILNPPAPIEPAPVETPAPAVEPTPAPEPAPAPAPETPAEPAIFEYTVVQDDNLTNICHDHYGLDKANGDAYRKALEIAKYNNIENPDLIFPGQKILLP
jgi:hypothetical protein